MPDEIPCGWRLVKLTSVAKLESGHTPSKRSPEYWDGEIPWISLHDSGSLDKREITSTQKKITQLGLDNSSARLLPAGTVVFSRTATVGKATTMASSMCTSQDFANYVCGKDLYNHYLVYLFRFLAPEWERLMAGSTHNSIYMPVFRELQILLPPPEEQKNIAYALNELDIFICSLDQLIAKKRDIQQATMQQLLTGQRRLPRFSRDWDVKPMLALGNTYGGLAGKTKINFGHGEARYIPFMNVMTDTVIDTSWLEPVDVAPDEAQNLAKKGDLFFNGSSETPEEVGFCSVLLEEIPNLYLNSFCFGFRFNTAAKVNGLFFAYWFRSKAGRAAMSVLAQGATRYNIAKSAFMQLEIPQPSEEEQTAIATILSDMDTELAALEARRDKARLIKQGMMQELLTGRIRLM